MISSNNVISIQVPCNDVFVIFFLHCIKKTIIRFVFCDILSNQVLSCQPQPLAWLVIILTCTLIIPDTAHKESHVLYPRASGFCCWASDFCYNLPDGQVMSFGEI